MQIKYRNQLGDLDIFSRYIDSLFKASYNYLARTGIIKYLIALLYKEGGQILSDV